jgi:phosphinothricin acetyltransferase
MNIRPGRISDLHGITEIRNHYILNSNALFETELERVEDRTSWFQRYSENGPHRILVAELDKRIVGYASSSKYRDGSYFSKTVELSVFVHSNTTSKGAGSKLYSALFEILQHERVHCAVAGIALPNEASIALHKKFGFQEVGIFKEYAMKNGQFYSSLWLQKMIDG